MDKILPEEKAIQTARDLKSKGKKIILAGGCFDILHIGHVKFLQSAKDQKGCFFLLLESDDAIRNTKGQNRPINSQRDRAELLASLEYVDFVVTLKNEKNNQEYDKLISQLDPDVIAITRGDPNRVHKERQAKLTGAKIVEVLPPVQNKSTSIIEKILEEN